MSQNLFGTLLKGGGASTTLWHLCYVAASLHLLSTRLEVLTLGCWSRYQYLDVRPSRLVSHWITQIIEKSALLLALCRALVHVNFRAKKIDTWLFFACYKIMALGKNLGFELTPWSDGFLVRSTLMIIIAKIIKDLPCARYHLTWSL